MKEKILIGITASFHENKENLPLSQNIVGRDYVLSIIAAGAIPIVVPVIQEKKLIEEYADFLDGLLLPGGEDVCPKYYGQNPHEKLGRVSEIRDHTELILTKKMAELKKPIFGICRGMQVLNSAIGGDLIQDIPSADEAYAQHFGKMEQRAKPWHQIEIINKKSKLYQVFGREKVEVNSFHHQAVDRVAEGFYITARAQDGIVEAIENPQAKIWGVQFHPENMAQEDPEFLNLFKLFVVECR